jgi:hypothetical protein
MECFYYMWDAKGCGMKSRIFILLAITMIICVSVMAFISDVHTDADLVKNSETIEKNIENPEEDTVALSNSHIPKSKLTLVILFLGGVGLAILRRNSFL